MPCNQAIPSAPEEPIEDFDVERLLPKPLLVKDDTEPTILLEEASKRGESQAGNETLEPGHIVAEELHEQVENIRPVVTQRCICFLCLFWFAVGSVYIMFWLLVIERSNVDRDILAFTIDEREILERQKPMNPLGLYCDPFEDEFCKLFPEREPITSDAVCGMKFEWRNIFDCPSHYSIRTYDDSKHALDFGGVVAHSGACGVCSNTQDMAAMATTDMTALARNCWKESGAVHGMRKASAAECIIARVPTMTAPCASLWSHFIRSIMKDCWHKCLYEDLSQHVSILALKVPHHATGGEEDLCRDCMSMQAEKVQVFHRYAGGTRVTGLAFPDERVRASLDFYPCPRQEDGPLPRTQQSLIFDP